MTSAVRYQKWFDHSSAIMRMTGQSDMPPWRHVWSLGPRYVAMATYDEFVSPQKNVEARAKLVLESA